VVNRSCLSRQAACRIRSIALGKFGSAFTAHPFLALSPELVLSEQIPLGQSPSLHSLRQRESHPFLFGRFCGTYWPVRLPMSVHRCRTPSGFAARSLAPSAKDRHGISRFPCEKLPCVRRVLDHARPKYTLRKRCILFCLPIPLKSSTPRHMSFRGSIPGPHVPLSTLRLQFYNCNRMTRGQCGSLILLLPAGFDRRTKGLSN